MNYRPDIDGLRAVAVLAVVLFHIEPNWVPGGFVGVDIFFVVSGFLITGIISREQAGGDFSFAQFYRRRVKRIVPALLCVLSATLVIGYLVLLPDDLEQLARSTIASLIFVSNIYFTYALDTSYFADSASLEPLLHLWSLGVEEQFYIFWPIILALATRYITSSAAKGLLLTLAIVVSFLSVELFYDLDPMFQYYMLPGRAGELLLGAAAFYVTQRCPDLSESFCFVLSVVGTTLIVASLVLLSGEDRFPGIHAVPVTLGVALVLIGGTTKNVVSSALSIRPAIWVGLISYSMYLWHWPILAFLKYALVDLTL